ncbi:MAG: cobalamin biosynthesis protein [Chloroflexi bacterium]|nr:cobalamin biosynthesis protein [Chloroflexota bacterium]
MMPVEIAMLLFALVIDQLLGEPPSSLHPVVWIGKSISLLERRAPRGAMMQLAYGVFVLVVVVGLFASSTYLLLAWLRAWNEVGYVIIGGLILKSTFAVRELQRAASRVWDALVSENLDTARRNLRHLVSRNTESLDQPLVVAATVESVAENVTDSFVSPVIFFVLFGVAGAVAYRAVNTLDSMIGYRGGYEHLGKAAARLDDLLNFVPARVAAGLTVVASAIVQADFRGAWRIMLRDHGLTASPNAGWTMSAMSGALGVQLEKIGCYRLGDPQAELSPLKILRAVHIMYVAVALTVLASIIVEVIVYVRPT